MKVKHWYDYMWVYAIIYFAPSQENAHLRGDECRYGAHSASGYGRKGICGVCVSVSAGNPDHRAGRGLHGCDRGEDRGVQGSRTSCPGAG